MNVRLGHALAEEQWGGAGVAGLGCDGNFV